jgi:hypothetical protein
MQGHRCAQIRLLFEAVGNLKVELLQWWCGTKSSRDATACSMRCNSLQRAMQQLAACDATSCGRCGTKSEHQQQRLLALERENEHLRDAMRSRPPEVDARSPMQRRWKSDVVDVVPSLAAQPHDENEENAPADIIWQPISALGHQYQRSLGTPQLIICANCGIAGPGNRLLSDEAPFLREQSRFKACHRCGRVWYCSLNCQMQHWRMHHRKVCRDEESLQAWESV